MYPSGFSRFLLLSFIVASLTLVITGPATATPLLSYSTYLGGSGNDGISGMAVDNNGFVYVVGGTSSKDFPTTSGSYEPTSNAGGTCTDSSGSTYTCGAGFITKMSQDGTALVYSTFFPANPTAVAVDSAGEVFITGTVGTSTIPITPGALDDPRGQTFVAKLDASGSKLLYAAQFGGTQDDQVRSIAVDVAGNAYITGWSYSSDYPVTAGAFQTIETGAFVTELNGDGSAFIYSARLGGSDSANRGGNGTHPLSLAVDSAGEVYITGLSDSSTFPTTANAFQTNQSGATDAFITKLNSQGSALIYSSLLGGGAQNGYGYEGGNAVAVDPQGNAYITGTATPATAFLKGFPVTAGAFQTRYTKGPGSGPTIDTFVAKINPNLSGQASLVYSTLLGRSNFTQYYSNRSIAVDNAGEAFVTGVTATGAFPTTSTAYQSCNEGIFVSALSAQGNALLFSTLFGGEKQDSPVALRLDIAGNAYIAGATNSYRFPVTPGAFRPFNTGPVVTDQSLSQDGFISKFDRSAMIPGAPAVVICKPLNGANLNNSFSLAGVIQDAKQPHYVRALIDGTTVWQAAGLSTVAGTLTAAAGNHTLTIQGQLASGTMVSKSILFRVGSNPPPLLGTLSPSSANAGAPGFSLMVQGSNFVPGSIVRWNGGNRTTSFVTTSELKAAISAGDIAAVGGIPVTVFSPGPGGGTSSPQTFAVNACTPGPVYPSVTICGPMNSSTIHSPVHILAATTESYPVISLQVYVDGLKKFQTSANSIDTTLPVTTGPHRITVRAKDSSGQLSQKTVNFTVN